MTTVQPTYKIGNQKLLKISENAGAKLASLLQRQGRINGALRVAVIGGGCSGLQYKMDLIDGPANRDILIDSQGVRVVIDPKSALFVSGSVLDYSDDLQKGGFKVTNPNAVAHCSCGESFSAEEKRLKKEARKPGKGGDALPPTTLFDVAVPEVSSKFFLSASVSGLPAFQIFLHGFPGFLASCFNPFPGEQCSPAHRQEAVAGLFVGECVLPSSARRYR